jgi:hypothetical protein
LNEYLLPLFLSNAHIKPCLYAACKQDNKELGAAQASALMGSMRTHKANWLLYPLTQASTDMPIAVQSDSRAAP